MSLLKKSKRAWGRSKLQLPMRAGFFFVWVHVLYTMNLGTMKCASLNPRLCMGDPYFRAFSGSPRASLSVGIASHPAGQGHTPRPACVGVLSVSVMIRPDILVRHIVAFPVNSSEMIELQRSNRSNVAQILFTC